MASAADPPAPLTLPDLTGPRTLALSAGVGLASGTEGLFLNPAAVAALKAYTADGTFLLDRRPGRSGSEDRQQYAGLSVVDAVSTPLAVGMSYVRAMKGVEQGNAVRLALAGPLTDGFYLGLLGKYYSLHGAEKVSANLNADAGLFWKVTDHIAVGGAAYDLLGSRHRAVMPRGYAAGLTVGVAGTALVTADWRVDLDRGKGGSGDGKDTNRYGIGAEYVVDKLVPVRAGFQVDETSDTKWWSLGAGVSGQRVALDLAFRQSVTDSSARTFLVALRGTFPNE